MLIRVLLNVFNEYLIKVFKKKKLFFVFICILNIELQYRFGHIYSFLLFFIKFFFFCKFTIFNLRNDENGACWKTLLPQSAEKKPENTIETGIPL